MSLLNTLAYSEYEEALKFSCEMCQALAAIAKVKINYSELRCPGKQLMFDLESVGYTVTRYHRLLQIYRDQTTTHTASVLFPPEDVLKPNVKLAILVANEMYKYQYKLKSPGKDCTDIGMKLKELGFVVVVLKDVSSADLNSTIESLMKALPPESYVFLYMAGHGAQLSGVRYIFSVDIGENDFEPCHMISENSLLSRIAQTRPLLCVLLMDVCAGNVEIGHDQELFESLPKAESYAFEGNLIIGYSSSSDQPAYEQVEIECNTDSVSSIRYLDTARHAVALAAGSVYAQALMRHLGLKTSVSRLLQRVTKDLENSDRKQIPVIIHSGCRKTYLFDEIIGDHEMFSEQVKTVLLNGEFENFTIL